MITFILGQSSITVEGGAFKVGEHLIAVNGDATVRIDGCEIEITPTEQPKDETFKNLVWKPLFSAIRGTLEANGWSRHNKIDCIKAVRSLLSCGLVEAKQFVDQYYSNI